MLNAYAEMLPRLKAENDMRQMNMIAAGSGMLKPSAFTKLVSRLTRQMIGRSEAPKPSGDPWGLGLPVMVEVKSD